MALGLGACSGGTTAPADGSEPSGGQAARAGGAGARAAAAGAGGSAYGGTSSSAGQPSAGRASSGTAGSGGNGAVGGGGNAGNAGAFGGGSAGAPPIPDDVGSGACQDFTPCGGDVVGSWDIEVCADPPLLAFKALCASASEVSQITGTAEFRADGSMTSTLRLAYTTTLPASCAASLGSCGVPGDGLNLLEDCTPGEAGSCVCDSVNEPAPSDATYTTSPGGLLSIVRGGETSYSYYCRQGDELWARGVDPQDGRISVLHFTQQ